MTILFVTHYSGFYGANQSLLTLTLQLRDRYRVTPHVLLPSEGTMCHILEEAGINHTVAHYYWWVNENHGVWQWLLNKRKQLSNCMRAYRISRLFKGHALNLVYTNSICVNMGYLIAKRLGLPHVWQARESLVQFSLSLPPILSRALWADPTNRRYLLVSDYMMAFYRTYLPNDRMVRVYNGVDLPQGMCRIKENRMQERLKIACVGVLCEQKNQMELLQAQRILLQRGIAVEVWLIGTEVTAYRQRIDRYVSEVGMAHLVHCTGHSDQVFDLLQEMNLGVVTAHDEAFGRVTIEYMLMQMPVVASHSGANAELVTPGITGELYPLGCPEALADAITLYIRQPERLASQGATAERAAKEQYPSSKNARLIYEQIQDVISH